MADQAIKRFRNPKRIVAIAAVKTASLHYSKHCVLAYYRST